MALIKSYLPILKINGVAVLLRSFRFDAPADGLSARADCALADVNQAVARGDALDLTIRSQFGSLAKRHLIKSGRVVSTTGKIAAARRQGLTVASDTLSVVAVDPIGPRLKLTSRTPMILFDPQLVTLGDTETDTNVNDEAGDRIYADTREVDDLDLLQMLDYAYVEMGGFAAVVTNIPTYAIPRADFNLNDSFHGVAASFYALFEPVVFEDANRIFIIDVFGAIPTELLTGARTVNVNRYLSLDIREPEADLVNAIMLTHRQINPQAFSEFPSSVTFRVDTDPADVQGSLLDGDYRSTTFKRYVAELHDDEEDLTKITSEVVYRTETATTGQDEGGTLRVLSSETQDDQYSNSWRLKLGYTKNIDAYIEDGLGGKSLQNVLTETNVLNWRAAPGRPGEYEKLRSQTQVEGLVLVEGSGDEETKTPLLDASRAKLILNDGTDDIQRLPILSKIEVWRGTGADQIEVHRQEIDLLNRRLKSSGTTEHVGTNYVRVRSGETFNTKQVLLTDAASDLADGPRQPASFDAGYISYAVAKELALRRLAALRSPRVTVSAELATFDGGIRRGSIRRLLDRQGVAYLVIIIGYQVEGMPLRMTVQGVVIG